MTMFRMWIPVLVGAVALTNFIIGSAPLTSRVLGNQIYSSEDETTKSPFLEVRNASYHGTGPREEARAMCSVRTQDVNATANATITRRLHGVVTPKEMNAAIHRLELIIFGQIQQVMDTLNYLREQLSIKPSQSYQQYRPIMVKYLPHN